MSGVQFRTVQYHGMERIDELFDGTVRGMERIDGEAARGQYDLVMDGLDWRRSSKWRATVNVFGQWSEWTPGQVW